MHRTRWALLLLLTFLGGGLVNAESREQVDSPRTATYDPAEAIVATDGQNFMGVWFDQTATPPGLYGVRLNPQREPLGDGFVIKEMPSSERVRPVIAFDGANFLVAWDENRRGERQSDIVGRLITRDGRRAGSEFVISDSSSLQHEVALAFDGTNYLVIWSDDRNRRFDMTGVRGFSIYGRMITPTGQLVGRELSVATGTYNHTLPAVTYNQSTYLVAWQRTPMEGCGSAIMGQIILTSGVLASSNFQISQSRSCAQTLRQPSTAPDDDQFLVVWGTDRGHAERVVYGQIVNSSGELMGSNFSVSHSGLHHLIPPDGVEEEGTAVRSLHF